MFGEQDLVDEWSYYPEPEPMAYLMGVRDASTAIKISPVLSTLTTTIWPAFQIEAKGFDRGYLSFEPSTPSELRWFHEVFKGMLKPGAEIVFLGD